MSSRSPVMAFYHAQSSLKGISNNSSNASLTASDLELTWKYPLSEFRTEQANEPKAAVSLK